jgi:hypothetical protein
MRLLQHATGADVCRRVCPAGVFAASRGEQNRPNWRRMNWHERHAAAFLKVYEK